MRFGLLTATLLVAMAPAAAHAMTVGEFLGKTNALKAKGVLAMGSPDIKLLTDEMKGIATAYRADVTAARAAGKTPHSCPPAAGSTGARMTSGDLLAELEKIPVVHRGMSMKTAFYGIMKRRYPCRSDS